MTLRARLLLAFAYVLLLAIVALEVPLALNLSRRVDAEVRSEALGQAQLLAASAAGRLDLRDDLERLIRGAARDVGGRVIVVDRAGRLLADSAPATVDGVSYASRPEIARALSGRTDQGTRRSASLDEELLFTSVPVVERGRPAGAVRVTQSVDAVNAEVRRDVLALVVVGLVVLVLGLSVAWLLARSLVRPLSALSQAARRVAAGDLDERAELSGPTEQREVASAFNEMTARLAGALRSQRDFVANASHQLRTPLTGLRLRLEAASLKSEDPEVSRELQAAERETERLARLLTDLLVLARERERPRGEPLELEEVATAAVERWEAPAQRSGHRLALGGGAGATVEASREDLAVILDNLIENALNYSQSPSTVRVAWEVRDEWACLVVLDEGPGVETGEQNRVFERFFRGHATRGAPGTGLGLAVVETLAERWGGSAAVTNRSDGGARAEVRLPAASRSDGALPKLGAGLDDALHTQS